MSLIILETQCVVHLLHKDTEKPLCVLSSPATYHTVLLWFTLVCQSFTQTPGFFNLVFGENFLHGAGYLAGLLAGRSSLWSAFGSSFRRSSLRRSSLRMSLLKYIPLQHRLHFLSFLFEKVRKSRRSSFPYLISDRQVIAICDSFLKRFPCDPLASGPVGPVGPVGQRASGALGQ